MVAGTLSNLGRLYSEAGRSDAAQKAFSEALMIYRDLALTNPTIYAATIAALTDLIANPDKK